MLSIILFILIGIELDIMHGLYLAMLILGIVIWIIKLILNVVKVILKYES